MSPLSNKATLLFAVQLLGIFVSDDIGAEIEGAGSADGQRYHASVGVVNLGANKNDFWSAPDIRVELRRHDRVVAERIVELADKIDGMNSDANKLRDLQDPILEKQRLSELRPGPKLTDEEAARLAVLAEKTDRTYEESRELRVLSEKKETSEITPGPPLSEDETAELEELAIALSELRAAIAQEQRSLTTLQGKVVGYSQEISTREKHVHFGWRYILTVYEDDVLLVKVVDVDTTEDDVFGEYAIRVSADLLASPTIHELGPTFDRGLRGLQIQFVAAED